MKFPPPEDTRITLHMLPRVEQVVNPIVPNIAPTVVLHMPPRVKPITSVVELELPETLLDYREASLFDEFFIFPDLYQNLSLYRDVKFMLCQYSRSIYHNMAYGRRLVEPFMLSKKEDYDPSKGMQFLYEKEDGDTEVFWMSNKLKNSLDDARDRTAFIVVFIFENRAGEQQFFQADEKNRLIPIEPLRILTATNVFVEMDQNENKLWYFNKFINALASILNCTHTHEARMEHVRFYLKQLSLNPDLENEYFPVDDRLAVVFVMAVLEREGCTLSHVEKVDLLNAVKEKYPYYAIRRFEDSLSSLSPIEQVKQMYPVFCSKELQSFNFLSSELKEKGLRDEFLKPFKQFDGTELLRSFYSRTRILPSEILSKEETIIQFFDYLNEEDSVTFCGWQIKKGI